MNTAWLLFVLLLDPRGQTVEHRLRLPQTLDQCRAWEQQEHTRASALRQEWRLVTHCAFTTTDST